MSDAAAGPPPEGYQDHGQLILGVIWCLWGIGTLVLGARLYTRFFLAKSPGWDDFWMVVTWVTGTITQGLDTAGVHYGIGKHLFYLTPHQRSKAVMFDWVSHAFAIASTGLGKVAFSVFLLRIIPTSSKGQRYFLHGYNFLLVAVNVPLIIITYVQCDPVKALWEPQIPSKCWNPHVQASYAIFQGAYGVAADFVLALFPIMIIWNLKVSKGTKFGLAGLMCLGIFAAGCAIMKTYYLPRMTARADFTWETQYMILWFTTEMYVILVAATVPTLRPLFLFMGGKGYGRGTYDNKGYQEHGPNNYKLSGYHSGSGPDRIVASFKQKNAVSDESESDKSVLDPTNIQKTTEVAVSYEDAENLGNKTADWGINTGEEDPKSVHAEDRV